MVLVMGGIFAVSAHAEYMASPGHPGWMAAEGSGCLVWNGAPAAGETTTWSGPCKGNRANGYGVHVWRNSGKKETARYVGEMHDGKPTGSGTKVWANGDRYEGNWFDGRKSGHGTFVWAIGDRYEGDLVDGKRSGHGTYVWANGNRYEGNWVDGKQTGLGKMTKANGDWYDGEWSGGYAYGEGKAKINGKKYRGAWARGCLRSMKQRVAWEVPRHQCPYKRGTALVMTRVEHGQNPSREC